MARAVLDPNVFVSAFTTPRGATARLLVELHAGAFELITSPLLLAELEEVLHREKFRRYVTKKEAAAFVELIRQASIIIDDPASQPIELSEDPGDRYLIALAHAAPVDALVSGDPHLIRLHDRIPVQTPREFLDSLTEPE